MDIGSKNSGCSRTSANFPHINLQMHTLKERDTNVITSCPQLVLTSTCAPTGALHLVWMHFLTRRRARTFHLSLPIERVETPGSKALNWVAFNVDPIFINPGY